MLEFGSATIFKPTQIEVIDCHRIKDVEGKYTGKWIIVIHVNNNRVSMFSEKFEDEQSALNRKAELIKLLKEY